MLQLGRIVDSVSFDLSLHQIVCGRNRKNIKLIESTTSTAIYFPPAFLTAFRYCPPNAIRREPQEILITGENPEGIALAKAKLHDVITNLRLYVKDFQISPSKIDSILLGRMDKVRKIFESHGTFVSFPPLASMKQGSVRAQGPDNANVERTVHELMALVG